MSGKTTGAAKILKNLREETERPLLVLDPNLDPQWQADYITDDNDKFKRHLYANEKCLFVAVPSVPKESAQVIELPFLLFTPCTVSSK